jgi:hypothetical protein
MDSLCFSQQPGQPGTVTVAREEGLDWEDDKGSIGPDFGLLAY